MVRHHGRLRPPPARAALPRVRASRPRRGRARAQPTQRGARGARVGGRGRDRAGRAIAAPRPRGVEHGTDGAPEEKLPEPVEEGIRPPHVVAERGRADRIDECRVKRQCGRACGRADVVRIVAYGGHAAQLWWKKVEQYYMLNM